MFPCVLQVETIGDAYMIVSGVPETTAVHAQLVANFAMDMVEEAGLVKSPATSLPLQVGYIWGMLGGGG